MTYYAADGSININILSSPSSFTGLYNADGSINVVASPGSTFVGAYHPCGALYVTNNTGVNAFGIRAPDGSLNVSVSPYYGNTQKVTVVSGSFGPSTSGAFIPLFF